MLRKVPHRRWRGTGLKYTPKHTTREVRRGGQGGEEAPLTQFAVAGRRDTCINTFSWVTSVPSTPSLILFRFISTHIFWISVCSSHPPSSDCSLMLLKKILCSRFLFILAQEKNPSAVTQCAAGSVLHQHSIIKVHASLTSFHLLYTTLCNVMTLSAISLRYTR